LHALLYGINYAPELTGIGKYTGEIAEWLAARGVTVTVVTAPPYYPAWRVEPPYVANRYHRETLRGVHVWRCPVYVPRSKTAVRRIAHLASFAFSSLPVLLWVAIRHRPRLIFVVEPPLLAAPAAWLAARLSGADAWLHVQDFEVDAAFSLGLLRTRWLRDAVLALERWLMRRFNRVSTLSERMLDRLATKTVPATRRALLPNWVELDRVRPLPAPPPLRDAHFAAGDIVVLYSGNIGAKQGLETVLEAARLLTEPHGRAIRFVLCGDGAVRQDLQRAARDAKNVAFWRLVPREQLNELLNVADIHVLPQRADAEDLVFPSKLTNMLASGRPVVATANAATEIAHVLEGCGIVVPPGDAAALAGAIRALAADAPHRRALGAAARRKAENLWDKQTLLTRAFKDYLSAADTELGAARGEEAAAQPPV
jgi:colanic acid biosynthesis glycosyl transferase WcaI